MADAIALRHARRALVTVPSRDSIPRQLVGLALPVVGVQVLVALGLAVDTAMVGRLPSSSDALSALALASQLVMITNVAMMGLSASAVALVARAIGARDVPTAQHLFGQATRATVLLGVLVGALGVGFARPWLVALGASPRVASLGVAYLVPTFAGSTFYYLVTLHAAVLRSVGFPGVAFVAALIATGTNVGLDYALVFGKLGAPALGVRGAAIATVVSQLVSLAITSGALALGRAGVLRLPSPLGPLASSALARLGRVGAPAAVDLALVSVSFVALVRLLATVDPIAVASHGIGLRLSSLAYVPGFGLSQAASAMVGQALGASDEARARVVARSAVGLATGLMAAIGLLVIVFAGPLLHEVFGVAPGSAVDVRAETWIRMLAVAMPFAGAHIALVGVLRGAGATTASLGINALGTFAVQIPVSAVFGVVLGGGAAGVWLGLPVAMVVKAVLAGFAYRRGTWARPGAEV